MEKEMDKEFEFLDYATPGQPANMGWLEGRLNKAAMDRLWEYAAFAEKDHSSKLAGNIYKELILEDKDDWFFKKILGPLTDKYESEFGYSHRMDQLTHNHHYTLNGFWINFQKKHEFNPCHKHTGVYSFVVWMQIPTYQKEQHNIEFSRKSNYPKASDFDFHYTDILGYPRAAAFAMNPDRKGMILFFPAELRHQVYPFYNNDGTRISISGNISLDSHRVEIIKNKEK